MFEFLFKYPWEFFERGSIILAFPGWSFALLPLAILIPVFITLGYFSVKTDNHIRHKAITALLRSLAIFLVISSLSRPLLEVSSLTPQPNVVAVLIDNSSSMNISDVDAGPRSDFINQQFDAEHGELLLSLQNRFDTKLFKFGEETNLLSDVKTLDYRDGDSDLVTALAMVQESLKLEPLAGLVVISDGAIRSNPELDNKLLSLRASGIPLYSIALGQTKYRHDIEIERVQLPREVLKGSRLVADVFIRQQGYDEQTVDLVVEDDSRIIHKQEILLKSGRQHFKIPLSATDQGARQLKFHLNAQPDEKIAANNVSYRMLAVQGTRKRILYFEGEPRFEFKFLRRAVADDRNLQVTGLVRTADAKFYRLGLESPQELRSGFPITRDQLFSYHALILGSVEISLLSLQQQEMIADFVSLRGGSLLLLGGRHAFAEGGYLGSVLQDISPVVLAQHAQPGFTRQIKVQPTAAAAVHPALTIEDSYEKSIARWSTLPALTIVNPIHQIKPGATMLLTGAVSAQDKPYVAMAFQRYGRGKVVAFPVQNSWIWQMHHEIDPQDQTHETLWKQLLRWMVDGVPQRLSLTLSAELIHANGIIKLRSEVLDADYKALNQARVNAILTASDGSEKIKPLTRDPSLPGVYQVDLSVASVGDYHVRVELEAPGEVISSNEARFKVSNEGSEYYQSEMNEKLLRKISSETGGEFFTPDSVDRLVDALATHQRGSTILLRYELWDMPVLFLMLVLLLCSEWGYRRWRGLV